MDKEIQELINDYNNFVKELRSNRSNKVSISEEEARKGIFKKLIEERKLNKADAEQYVNNIFSAKRTKTNTIITRKNLYTI